MKIKKPFKGHRLVVFSRHPSHSALRHADIKLPVLVSIRFGSTNVGERPYALQLNKPEAVEISSNKLLMKKKFDLAAIKTAKWYFYKPDGVLVCAEDPEKAVEPAKLKFPIVAKHILGSRGTGNYKLDTVEQFNAWKQGKDMSMYIIERFYPYSREYRLHVTSEGCFYTCRKMLKEDTPENQRWYRNDSNSVWIVEDNAQFNKPKCWDAIVEDCVKALTTVGLDVAAFDVKVSAEDDKEQKYIVIESNSAPSFGDITLQKYIEQIPKIVASLTKG